MRRLRDWLTPPTWVVAKATTERISRWTATALLAWFAERGGNNFPRWIALITLALGLLLSLSILWLHYPIALPPLSPWFTELNLAWIPRFGISFRLALDGLSLTLIILTFFLGLTAVATSWSEITECVGSFHCNLLWTLAGMAGVSRTGPVFVIFPLGSDAGPLHTWLPDAHTEASTGGSVIFVGLLLKTSAYGLLRFVVPCSPTQRCHSPRLR